ncbi:MAG TPA: methyltransferase domain-containing protein [Bryobacteraceae bacterium]|nr:methyltransferase domain-containing protein [Bryobacteraceae bacterium]
MSTWDAARYQDRHSFVWRFGANLVELLHPQAGERILDLGCGTGQLTAEIARSGAAPTGLDSSSEMLAEARKNYPDLEFVLGDAADFSLPDRCDAVFSNAALHWVKNAEGAVQSIRRALHPGGRFVAELGGKGNIASIQAALRVVLGPDADARSPWYYPSVSQYAALLDRNGFEVREASLFDRPTQLQGEDGMENWLRMFTQNFWRDLSPERTADALRQLVDHLRPAHYSNGTWTVDYRRLRVVAVRTS